MQHHAKHPASSALPCPEKWRDRTSMPSMVHAWCFHRRCCCAGLPDVPAHATARCIFTLPLGTKMEGPAHAARQGSACTPQHHWRAPSQLQAQGPP